MLKNMVNDIEIKVENTRRRDEDFDESWDPMQADYENTELNSYVHGPGANLDISMQRPAYRNAKNEVVYKIMVNRIPQGLTQVGLENIFLNCGSPKIAKCYKENGDRIIWALIEFKTMQEAERAILMLDNQLPLNMRVSFARSDEENERLKKKKEEEERLSQKWAMESAVNSSFSISNQKPGSNRQLMRTIGRGNRGKFILNAYRQNCERGSGLKNCMWSNGIPDFRDPGGLMYNPRSNQHDTSNKYMQGFVVTTTGKNSVRRVVMGRGFVPPEAGKACPPSDCEIIFEKTFGSDVMVPLLRCRTCCSETTQKCSQCGTPYCSRKCQKDDYRRHKPECATKECIDYPVDANSQKTLKFVPMCEPLEAVQKVETAPSQQINSHCSSSRENVVTILKEGTEAVIELKSADSGLYHGTLSCREVFEVTDRLLNLGRTLQHAPLDLHFWPAPGALVAVKYEGSVCRACVLYTPIIGNSTVFKVALCDYAKIEDIEVENIFKLTSDFYNLPELAVTCDVLQSSPQLDAIMNGQEPCMSLKVEGLSSSKVTAHVVGNNGEVIGVVSISPWVPCKQWLIPVQLVTPCQVIITAYHNQNALYVRPAGRNYQEQMFTVLQMVAAVVATSPPLDRAPNKGEMVACFYKNDGNYYRAIVQDRTCEEYLVFFVDFGDTCMASMQNMKFLPWEIKVKPCMAVKVSLKGVTQGPLTDDAVRYLNMLVQKEQQLRLECSKQDTDGVELFLLDGQSLNSKIQEYLTPEWKNSMSNGQDPHKGEVFLIEDTKVLPLIKGGLKSGFTNVWVTSVMANGRVAVCPVDRDRPEIEHVLETLSFQINEYCESTDPNSSYNPRENEVCLVKFRDGLWHRAVNSMTLGATQTCQVLFLDFGNVETVPFTNIRRMLPDFVSAPTIMSMCTLDGIPGEPPLEMIQKIIEIVPANKQYEVEVLSEIGKGEYKIRIPEFSHQLKSLFSEVN